MGHMKKIFIFSLGLLFIFNLFVHPLYAAARKEKYIQAPNFPQKGVWLNTDSSFKDAFKDKVTLVYFWDYSSVNSLRELGYLKFWHDQYQENGFQLIFIHSPEFEFAKKKENVELALDRFQIDSPVFLDNDFKLWDKYEVKSWPTKYLVNEKGEIVYSQVGEGDYLETENQIRHALQNLHPENKLPAPVLMSEEKDKFDAEVCGEMSSDTYMGYERAGFWGGGVTNKRWLMPNQTVHFRDRGQREDRGFFAEGIWFNDKDAFRHARETEDMTDYIGMVYMGQEVYAVVNYADEELVPRIYVTRDEEPIPAEKRGKDIKEDSSGNTYFFLLEPRLYYLISNEDSGPHEIKLYTNKEGVEVHSFSFANQCLSLARSASGDFESS